MGQRIFRLYTFLVEIKVVSIVNPPKSEELFAGGSTATKEVVEEAAWPEVSAESEAPAEVPTAPVEDLEAMAASVEPEETKVAEAAKAFAEAAALPSPAASPEAMPLHVAAPREAVLPLAL